MAVSDGLELLLRQRATALQIYDSLRPVLSDEIGIALADGGNVTLAFRAANTADDVAAEFATRAVSAVDQGVLFANRQPIVVAAVPNAYVPAVERALEGFGRIITFREPCQLVLAPPDTAPCPKHGYHWCTPDGTVYELGRCYPHDVPKMLSQWKYASASAAAKLKGEVVALPSAAVRRVRRWGNTAVRELVAWCLLRGDGCMGVLHVMPEHRKRGLARLCVASLLQQQAAAGSVHELGATPPVSSAAASSAADDAPPVQGFSFLADYNSASQQLFRRLGFHFSQRVTWLVSAKVRTPKLECRQLSAPCPQAPPLLGMLSPAVDADLQALAKGVEGASAPPTQLAWHAVYAAMNAAYREDDGFALDQLRVQWGDVQALAAQCSADRSSQALLCLVPGDGTGGSNVADGMPPPSAAQWWSQHHASQYAPVAPSRLLPAFVHVRGVPCNLHEVAASVHAVCPELKQLPSNARVMQVHLGWLCVAPFYKGRGLSAALLQQASHWATAQARQHGCNASMLHCHIIHIKPWLPQWYTRQGFRVHSSAAWPVTLRSQLKRDTLFWAAVQFSHVKG